MLNPGTRPHPLTPEKEERGSVVTTRTPESCETSVSTSLDRGTPRPKEGGLGSDGK